MTLVNFGMRIDYVRPNGIACLIDADGLCHGAATDDVSLFLREPSDIVGRTVHEMNSRELADLILPIIQRVIADDTVEECSYTVVLPRGRRHRHAWFKRHQCGLCLWDSVDVSELPHFLDMLSRMKPIERNVWLFTCQGYTAKEIAAKLDISLRSVSRHRKAAFVNWRT